MNRPFRVPAAVIVLALGLATVAVSCGCPPPPNTGPTLALPRRVVGRAPGDECPAPRALPGDHWEVRALFADDTGPTPAFLRGHCVYEWTGAGTPDFTALPADQLLSLAEDPPVVAALGATFSARDVAVERRGHLLEHAWPAASGASPAFVGALADRPPVFIGFPDASPSNRPASAPRIPLDGNAHGFNLAWITRFLTCPPGGGACLSEPLTELAFDLDSPAAAASSGAPGAGKGAAFGARTGLAEAIYRIVKRWKQAGGDRRLVLNLAAGWEPAHECAPPLIQPVDVAQPGSSHAAPPSANATSDLKQGPRDRPHPRELERKLIAYPRAECNPALPLTESSQLVYKALIHAACEGALLLAAAGNEPGYSPPLTGPMYPAAWEKERALNRNECRALGTELRDAAGGDGPLVHGVAGVNGADLPILLGRRGSRTRLAAPASLLVAFPDAPGDADYAAAAGCSAPPCPPSFPMTGTSVGAAVTSAIAAAVWAHRPTWTARQVIDAVHAGGELLRETVAGASVPLRPDVCFGACETQEIRRVSLCGAVQRACSDTASPSCPALPSACGARPAYLGGAPPDPGADRALAERSSVAGSPTLVTSEASAHIPFVLRSTGVITGQPVIPCPPCGLVKSSPGNDRVNVLGDIAVSFFSETHETLLRRPVVRLFDRRGNFLGAPALTGTPAWSPTSLAVDLSLSVPPGVSSATLTFEGGSGALYTQELPLSGF